MRAPGESAVVRWGHQVARVGLWSACASLAATALVGFTAEPSLESAMTLLYLRLALAVAVVVACVGSGMVQVARLRARRKG